MSRRIRGLGTSVILCGMLGACADTAESDDIDGPADAVAPADSPQTLPHEKVAHPGHFVLTEERRIGTVDGPATATFGRVAALVPGADGGVWVLDSHGPTIRTYDAAGQYVRDVGRAGRGPGEYLQVIGMRSAGDGRVAILDLGNGRITIFDQHGDYERSIPVTGGVFADQAFHIDTDGFFYVRSRRPGITATSSHAWRRISPSGEPVGWLDVPSEDGGEDTPVVITPEGPLYPFSSAAVFALTPQGKLVSGRNDRYAFDIIRDGDTVRVVHPHEVVPVRRGEREDWERLFERWRQQGRPAKYTIPSMKPAYRGLEVDDDGRIWVDRYVTAYEDTAVDQDPATGVPQRRWREPRTFDVFEADGNFMGTIVLPPRTRVLARGGPVLWAVQTDELGVAYVIRFRMSAPPDR